MVGTRSFTSAVATVSAIAVVFIFTVAIGTRPSFAKGGNDPATECLVQLQGEGGTELPATASCTDGDACDGDGATNGECAVKVRVAVNVAGVAGCTPQPLKKLKVTPKKAGITVSIPSGSSSATGAFTSNLILKLKKNGAKPSKPKTVKANVKAIVKKTSDTDKSKITCQPCPTESCVPATTTTTTTGASATTTLVCSGPSAFDFTSTAGSGTCGNTFRDVAGTTLLKNLLCGTLSLGGGLSQVPDNTTPAGATNRFSLCCAGSSCTVGSVAPETAEYDCSDTGCLFGTPLPISNAGLSVCVTNTFSAPASGTLDTATGTATLDFELTSETVLTGNPTQPCPRCSTSVGGPACAGSVDTPCTGVCDGSPNGGASCTTTNPDGLTRDCPAPDVNSSTSRCYRGANNGAVCTSGGDCPQGMCALFIGNIPISLNPLTTATASRSSDTGTFCPGQMAPQMGAFKSDICRTGTNVGQPCQTGAAETVDATNCGPGGLCRPGTNNNYCSAGTNAGIGCVTAGDCGTGGACVRAGTLAQLISETGTSAGVLATGTPQPIKLVSVFCVPLTESSLVNGNANLPGPGATAIVGTVTLVP